MSLLSIVAFPLHLLASLLRFLLTGLRTPLPALRLGLLNIYARLAGQPHPRTPPRDPYAAADRWVRALEEDTGAQCLSRARADSDAGPSAPALRSRHAAPARVLPDFMRGSYEDALRACVREMRPACVVLVSAEHDDTPDFTRNTLTDPRLVDALHANAFVVWGGDVRDYEPWSAAQKLQATTYPFVAFLALQPPRPGGGSGGAPALTVLSRHQGRTATAAPALAAHIATQLLPRVAPYLARLRAQARARDAERALRAEQDAAFHAAAARDLETRRAREHAERERAAREDAEARRVERRARWRRSARRAFVRPEAQADAGDGAVRLGVRLPDGQRLVRAFGRAETLSHLYAFVDAHLAPADEGAAEEDEGEGEGEAGLAELVRACGEADAWWGFKLFTAYPRREIAWAPGVALAQVEGLERGGQLVVEIAGPRAGGGGDGYETEESE